MPTPGPVGGSIGHPVRVKKQRWRKVLRVLIGVLAMAAFVVVAFAVVVRYAGGWGVPYFSFTNERGSHCVNNLTGYTCSPTTLADVKYFGDIDLPDDTRVVSGTYHSTHDYQLDSVLEVPPAQSASALKTLNQAFGRCVANHPSPIDTKGLTNTCVMANDDSVLESGEPTSRVYTVATGVRKDGTRVIGLSIRSR